MPETATDYFLIMGLVTAGVLFYGIFLLFSLKHILIIRLLLKRCQEENIPLIISPGLGMWCRNDGTNLRGIVALTGFELIFIPIKGKESKRLPMPEIENFCVIPEEPGIIMIIPEDKEQHGTFRVRTPKNWNEEKGDEKKEDPSS